MFYDNSLLALERSSRWRSRKVPKRGLADFASNDYLGLCRHAFLAKKAFLKLKRLKAYAPGASMLVNGYHDIHRCFEKKLCKANGFEAGALLGSGFLANLGLLESLVRKSDVLFIDESYHASGQLAIRLLEGRVRVFRHNDPSHLRELLHKEIRKKNTQFLIAIEGVYSMSGIIASKDFTQIATEFQALLLVDEAHSSGTIGTKLLGYFDYHHIPIQPNYIKMGTLSKAYASYGAYVLAHKDIIAFLENRSKPLIYSTALSLFDTALAHIHFEYISQHSSKLATKLHKRQEIWSKVLDTSFNTPIIPIACPTSAMALEIQKQLESHGFCVSAIRPPTVAKPILRIIASLANKRKQHQKLSAIIMQYLYGAIS